MRHRRRFTVVILAVALGTGALLAGQQAVRASHQFSDVPTAAGYHDAVSWLAARAITLGCAAGVYCPDANVTRAQMALFMNRLGKTLSATFFGTADSGMALDIDTTLHLCQTAPLTPTAPRRAKLDVWFGMRASGLASAQVRPAYSTDGGTTWNSLLLFGSNGRASASATGEWGFAADHDVLDLDAGTAYLFSVRVSRDAGTADPDEWGCKTLVQVTNRNPDGENPETALTGRTRGRGRDLPPQGPARRR